MSGIFFAINTELKHTMKIFFAYHDEAADKRIVCEEYNSRILPALIV
jgi:hypothetical protein